MKLLYSLNYYQLINLLRQVGVGDDQFPLSRHVMTEGPINIALSAGVYVTLAPIALPPELDVDPQDMNPYGPQNTTDKP